MSQDVMPWNRFHHIALIAGDYGVSKRFYVATLGFHVIAETYRAERDSWKLDLELPGGDRLELFSFPGAPPRPDRPEARGLRHLAFEVEDVAAAAAWLRARSVDSEPIRVDPLTGKEFTFFFDPDGLPLELYQA